jgi:hypothetical protein
MSTTAHKQYTCFIASPGDVQPERNACEDAIAEINRSFADKGISLRLVRWEKNATPALGQDGQAVVNEQLSPGDADFFVGVFWARFGEPTPRADSGTEEEFNLAFDRWNSTRDNHVLLFFKTANVPTDIDGTQLEKVKEFKKRASQMGAFYKEFSTTEEFAQSLRETITKILLKTIPDSGRADEGDDIKKVLSENLVKALSVFQEDIQWIDRYVCERNQLPRSLADLENKAVSIDTIVDSPDSFIVSAPPQFGLTSAAHHLRLLAWEKGQAWGYVDMDRLPPLSDIVAQDQRFFHRDRLDCVIVDSWDAQKSSSAKVFEIIESALPSVRIVVMHTRSELGFSKEPQIRIKRDWKARELLPMPRQSVRKAVSFRCSSVPEDENTVLEKLLGDLESMNIPRTPINCWTILKASESRAEHSPVNRTELFDMLLSVLFTRFNPPTYGTLPDTKDCNRFLGSFCEQLIRETKTYFTKREFVKHCSEYCDRQLIDVDVEVVFDILVANRIVVRLTSSEYRFGASFWIYYFGAKQMEQSDDFKRYVLDNRRYASFPEIIEFYTGSTRDRAEVLTLLDADLEKTRETMNSKLAFPKGFNPLKGFVWLSSPQDIKRMKAQLTNGVSSLPACIRDQHADKDYDYRRPYDQTIQKCMEESSFFIFIQQIKALSRALRNSDYAKPEIRIKVVRHILSGWVEIAKVIFALSPMLARLGHASWEGFGFVLDESFQADKTDFGQLLVSILESSPQNVVFHVKNDLSSHRIGKLLYNVLESELGELARHLLMLYLVLDRPPRWSARVRSYINSLDNNSFYLCDVFGTLGFVLRYDFPTEQDRVEAFALAKVCLGKHEKKPLNRISNQRILAAEPTNKQDEKA